MVTKRFVGGVLRAGLVLLPVAVAGCASGTMLSTRHLGSASTLATSADIRLVTASPVPPGTTEFVQPKQIICAEPSPDVAKIVSDAFGGSGAFSFKGKGPNIPANADLNTTLALSRAYTEGVAQMTERLATIQLLRDGLYRACEAYSNGAISATTYAAMVSRYDKTMVTMLMGELAAGNFGRSLAALGGSANATSSAEQTLSELKDRESNIQNTIDRTTTRHRSLKDQLNALPKDDASSAAQEATLKEDVQDTSDALKQSQSDLKHVQDKIDQTQKASSSASGSTTATAAGTIARNAPEAAAAIAGDLVQMQANYLNDHNVDAVKIACLSALGRDGMMSVQGVPLQQPSLLRFCDTLVRTLIDNEKDVMEWRRQRGLDPTEGAVKQLIVPDSHAAGPYFAPAQPTSGSIPTRRTPK